jgi:hypothetical protein
MAANARANWENPTPDVLDRYPFIWRKDRHHLANMPLAQEKIDSRIRRPVQFVRATHTFHVSLITAPACRYSMSGSAIT